MKFALAVHGSPYGTTAQQHALAFARACLAEGHQVYRVFFYHDGVYAGLATRVAPQDEGDVTSDWQALASEHGVELAVCIANALKRGVVNEGERDRYELTRANLAEGFELVGLGQLIEAIAEADRYVEFPA